MIFSISPRQSQPYNTMKRLFRHQKPQTPGSALIPCVVLLVPLLFVACSQKKETPVQTASQGKLLIKGSNTIGEELGPRLISEYKKEHPSSAIQIESKATGYGIAALLAGQCDVAAASRAPIQEELGLAKERGIELKEYPIGSYSVAV